MEEYEYLENLNSEELAKIIDQMLDFEETTKALMILEEKDSQKALELGKDIIKNNKAKWREKDRKKIKGLVSGGNLPYHAQRSEKKTNI